MTRHPKPKMKPQGPKPKSTRSLESWGRLQGFRTSCPNPKPNATNRVEAAKELGASGPVVEGLGFRGLGIECTFVEAAWRRLNVDNTIAILDATRPCCRRHWSSTLHARLKL